VILVTVLWAVALLSALAMAATVTFRAFSGIVAIDKDRVRAEGLLTAGLEVAAGMVANAGDVPLADIESTVTLSSGLVHLRLDDEGGRIDIGQAPFDMLAALFRALGAPDADAVARRIVQWREADASAAKGLPAAAAGKKPAPNAAPSQAFNDVRDLLQIPGVRPEWVAAAAPLTTVFGNETVNPLTAPPEVLAVLPGVARGRLASFLDTRRMFPTDTARLAALLGPAAQAHLDAKQPQAVSVKLAARLADGYAAEAAAVIVCLKDDREPYRVLAWKPLPPPNP
jgi:general secretion pathway protein K